mgnify:CR=1 FL=1
MKHEVMEVLAKIIASNIHKFDTQKDREIAALSVLEKYGNAENAEDINYFNGLYNDNTRKN